MSYRRDQESGLWLPEPSLRSIVTRIDRLQKTVERLLDDDPPSPYTNIAILGVKRGESLKARGFPSLDRLKGIRGGVKIP